VTDPRPDRADVEAVEQAAVPYLPAEDSPRRLRLAVAAAAAVHALLLIAPLPDIQAQSAEADKKVYLVVPVQRFKPPEPPPEPERREERARIVPVPDPDPTDLEPLRLAETLEPRFDLPPFDGVIDIPDAPPEPEPDGPLPIGGAVTAPVRVEGPLPVYPEVARRARIECTVLLQSVIDKTGRVTEIEVDKPCPFGLSEAAVAAVERWRYAPATLKGLPVAVYMTLTVGFSLN
jgi:protein TonB